MAKVASKALAAYGSRRVAKLIGGAWVDVRQVCRIHNVFLVIPGCTLQNQLNSVATYQSVKLTLLFSFSTP